MASNQHGQAFIETVASGLLFYGVVIFAFGVIFNFMAQNLLTRWAHANSRCIATTNNSWACAQETRNQLRKYFGLRNVNVESSITRGVIHSKLSVPFIGKNDIVAKFDLMAPEYKRVK